MAMITKDTLPVKELKQHLVGKSFVFQTKKLHIRQRVIVDVQVSMKILFESSLSKAFYKPTIYIIDNRDKSYLLEEIWIESEEEYKDFGGTFISDATNITVDLKEVSKILKGKHR